LVLIAQKQRTLRGLHYVISIDPSDFSVGGPNCIGTVSSNLKGTEFTIYDTAIPYYKVPREGQRKLKDKTQSFLREELSSVTYVSFDPIFKIIIDFLRAKKISRWQVLES